MGTCRMCREKRKLLWGRWCYACFAGNSMDRIWEVSQSLERQIVESWESGWSVTRISQAARMTIGEVANVLDREIRTREKSDLKSVGGEGKLGPT